MATIPMWWARSSVTGVLPSGVSVSFVPGGLSISGGVAGPPSPFLGLGESSLFFGLFAQFWLFSGNIPAGTRLVSSTPLAVLSGDIFAYTTGGVWPFGPWPVTTCDLVLIQRVSSSGAPVATRSLIVPLISFVDQEWFSDIVLMPSPVALPTIQFDLLTNPNISIDTTLIFRLRFRGTGWISFSQFVTSPPFVVNVPQWNLVTIP